MVKEPLWLSVARAFVGIAEKPGPGSTPVILRWARDIGAPAWYNDDDQAWCAVWFNRVLMAMQMPMTGTGFELIRAASAATWGAELAAPALGCVLVFKRPEGYHVGFYVGERDDAYYVLGANQGNAVSYTWIGKDRLLKKGGIRWPPGQQQLSDYRPILLANDGGPASTNEA